MSFNKIFNKVSIVFKWSSVFSILLLHGSHRSYPSRRKACFANYIVCFISLAQTFCCSFCDISVIVGANGIVVIGGVRFDVMIFCCCQ